MTEVQAAVQRALYQAALEGDTSPKIMLSERVVELLMGAGPASTSGPGVRPSVIIQVLDAVEVKERRERLGISQAKLAEAAGTTQQTVDRIERGLVRTSAALPAIERALAELEA